MTLDPNPHRLCSWGTPQDWDLLDVNAQVPDQPGFYAFTDHDGALRATVPEKSVLYVGIASQSLRGRLRKYKRGDTSGIENMHRGGLFLLLSRAAAAPAGGKGDEFGVTHSIQRKAVEVTVKPGGRQPSRLLAPEKIFVRWAVDPRAAIEAMLIRDLRPRYNTMHRED